MKRLAIGLPALLAAWLCSACLASTDGSLDESGVNSPASQPRAIT